MRCTRSILRKVLLPLLQSSPSYSYLLFFVLLWFDLPCLAPSSFCLPNPPSLSTFSSSAFSFSSFDLHFLVCFLHPIPLPTPSFLLFLLLSLSASVPFIHPSLSLSIFQLIFQLMVLFLPFSSSLSLFHLCLHLLFLLCCFPLSLSYSLHFCLLLFSLLPHSAYIHPHSAM